MPRVTKAELQGMLDARVLECEELQKEISKMDRMFAKSSAAQDKAHDVLKANLKAKQDELDQIRAAFQKTDESFGHTMSFSIDNIHNLNALLNQCSSQRADLETEVMTLRNQLEEAKSIIEKAQAQLTTPWYQKAYEFIRK